MPLYRTPPLLPVTFFFPDNSPTFGRLPLFFFFFVPLQNANHFLEPPSPFLFFFYPHCRRELLRFLFFNWSLALLPFLPVLAARACPCFYALRLHPPPFSWFYLRVCPFFLYIVITLAPFFIFRFCCLRDDPTASPFPFFFPPFSVQSSFL